MVTWEQPVKVAFEAAQQLYPQGEKFLLEEVEKDRNDWLITISFQHPFAAARAMPIFPSKVYKQFRISGDTKEVKAMKIRDVG
jgi:hypothetical protein